MSLEGKVALITGASRGIGEATAVELAARGCHVMLAARDMAKLEKVKQRIEADGGSASVLRLDLAEPDSVAGLAAAVAEQGDTLDILMINAAISPPTGLVKDVDRDEFRNTMLVNVIATQELIATFHPMLERSESGRLIAMTSAAGLRPFPTLGTYCASKAAFDMLVHTYAQENGDDSSIRTALVAPGPTRTQMRADAFPDEDPMTLKTAEFVAEAIADLADSDFPNDHYLDIHQVFMETAG